MKKVRTAPKSDLIFTVGEESQLHQFLAEKFDGKSRSALKSLLAHRRVSVNGTVTTAYDSAHPTAYDSTHSTAHGSAHPAAHGSAPEEADRH